MGETGIGPETRDPSCHSEAAARNPPRQQTRGIRGTEEGKDAGTGFGAGPRRMKLGARRMEDEERMRKRWDSGMRMRAGPTPTRPGCPTRWRIGSCELERQSAQPLRLPMSRPARHLPAAKPTPPCPWNKAAVVAPNTAGSI